MEIKNPLEGLTVEDIQSNITIKKEYQKYKEQFLKKDNLNNCPGLSEYKTVIGNDVMVAIEEYFKLIKKSKKENKIPRKQQLFFEKAVACHLLLELTYYAMKTGWQWGLESTLNNNKEDKLNDSTASAGTDNKSDSNTTN